MAKKKAKPKKNPAAVELGRLGGLVGGDARAKALTKKRRSEIAAEGAAARMKALTKAERSRRIRKMTKENEVTNRPVLVTTQHRGVFFGYEESRDGTSIVLKRARNCVRWSGTRGFVGLAADGPNDNCRIGPPAERLAKADGN